MPTARRLTRDQTTRGVLIACLVLATLLAAAAQRQADDSRRSAVTADRQRRAEHKVAEAAREPLERLDSLAAAVRATGAPSAGEFEIMTRPVIAVGGLRSSALIAAVQENQRARFERRTGLKIVDVVDGRYTPAPARPVHYVVLAVAGRRGAQAGVDLAADAVRATALRRAQISGGAALTQPVQLIKAGGKPETAVIAYRYTGSGTFVSVAISQAGLARTLLSAVPPGTGVRISDVGRSVASLGPAGARRSSLRVADRTWEVRIHTRAPHRDPWALLVLLGGLALSAAVVAAMLAADRRQRVISAEVDQRLAERDRERVFTASVLATMPDGLGISDDTGLINVNPALCELSGYPREELIGSGLPSPMWPPDSHAALAEAAARADRDGRTEVETVLRTKDGALVPVLLAASTVRNADGGVRMRIGVVKDIRERVAAERALAARESSLRTLADAAAEVVLRLSTDERIEWASASAGTVLGRPPEELTGLRLGELFRDDPVGAGGIDRNGGIRRLRRSDGRWLWTETTLRPLRDDDGEVVGIRASLRDVTEREDARRELQLSEARYRTLAATLPDTVVLMTDRDLRFVLAEGAALDAAGWRREQVEGRTVHELLTDPSRRSLLEGYERALAGTPVELSYAIPSGRAYLTRITPLRGWDGEIDGVLAVSVDVTVLRRQEEAARRADARFRRMFEHASTGIGMIDADGRIIETNATFARMLATESAELTGVPLGELVHPDDREAVHGLRELFSGDEIEATLEVRLRARDDTEAWALIAACRLPDAEDDRTRVLCQVQEIGAHKSLEASLRDAADHDALTGILNRRGFEARAAERLAEDRRHAGRSAVLVADLDGFKAVNDTLGHAAGDALLRRVSAALRDTLRAEDLLARLGGDEFAILVPHADTVDLDALADRAGAAIASHSPEGLPVTASFGIAPLSAGSTLSDALAAADRALYGAKAAGRARHHHAPVA